ncbi:hypothetical protein AB0J38_22795 [Streptomyces sp. NPDC050095]|uniref:hypothetical protein n=1 Tax=unclassified Streptomyces TaxID=2593676 RepID=UPI00341E27A1
MVTYAKNSGLPVSSSSEGDAEGDAEGAAEGAAERAAAALALVPASVFSDPQAVRAVAPKVVNTTAHKAR